MNDLPISPNPIIIILSLVILWGIRFLIIILRKEGRINNINANIKLDIVVTYSGIEILKIKKIIIYKIKVEIAAFTKDVISANLENSTFNLYPLKLWMLKIKIDSPQSITIKLTSAKASL